jgi:predicted RNase H-like HicB family nuclease
MPTTGKRKGSPRKRKDAVRRPFDADLLARARSIAEGYQIVVRREDDQYVGRGLEMPECIGTGPDPRACVEDARELMTTAVAVLLENGQSPPPLASEGARTEQVNIRFSAEEKLELETAARQQGFRGVSDYVRAAALRGSHRRQ